MINVLLSGCNGRMGQVITRLAKDESTLKITAGIDLMPGIFNNGYPVYTLYSDIKEEISVVIDFSNVKGIPALLDFCTSNKLPVVICTTGLSPEDTEMVKKASEKTAVLTSANMSVGVNLLLSLVKTAAKALEDSFDIEIIEKHHNQKVDSPSGTALAIADSINSALTQEQEYVYGRHSKSDKRTKREIGIHAVRGGNIVGEHSVIFAGAGEVIEINHNALSRDVFGVGALSAAKYLYNKKLGLYNMDNVINQI